MKIVLGCVYWIPSWCQLESVYCLQARSTHIVLLKQAKPLEKLSSIPGSPQTLHNPRGKEQDTTLNWTLFHVWTVKAPLCSACWPGVLCPRSPGHRWDHQDNITLDTFQSYTSVPQRQWCVCCPWSPNQERSKPLVSEQTTAPQLLSRTSKPWSLLFLFAQRQHQQTTRC